MSMTADMSDIHKFFDEWSALAKSDPVRFEVERKLLFDRLLAEAPERNKAAVALLIERMNTVRANAKDPAEAMVSAMRLLGEKVGGEGGLYEAQVELAVVFATEFVPLLVQKPGAAERPSYMKK